MPVMNEEISISAETSVHPLPTEQEFIPPVEVFKKISEKNNDIAVVYSIGDEMSFLEFIRALRCILACHQNPEDILDDHKFKYLSGTKQHPVLPKMQDAQEPWRWLHVKLQAKVGDQTSHTTLLMRGDNLYVLGFVNQEGVVYGLQDENRYAVKMLPVQCMHYSQDLKWSVKYQHMIKAKSSDEAAHKLAGAHLGCDFAMNAVRRLSSFNEQDEQVVAGMMNPRMALAGLIVIVCESARMNPIHDAIARGWRNGTGFTEQLMRDFVWGYYGKKSKLLQTWKGEKYNKPKSLPQHPIKELQDIYLVLNNLPTPAGEPEKNNHQHKTALKQTHEDSQHSNNGGQKNQHNSSSNSNQRNEADSHSSGNGGQQNQGNRRHSDGSNGDDSKDPSKPMEADESQGYDQGHGRPRVELLAMRADLRVGTKIVVFDGKRGQIIYIHKEQGQQGMADLVLTGPYTGISVSCGCFAIKIDIPDTPPIKWQWDGYDLQYAAEVDEPPVTRKIHNVAEVTYAVMSDALEATVEVMLQLKDGQSPTGVYGKITAGIDGFGEGRSVLFDRTPDMAVHSSDSQLILDLARNVVAVPWGRVLHIEVDLNIKTSSNPEDERLNVDLDFANGNRYRSDEVAGNKVEVNITWYPEIARQNDPLEQIIDDSDHKQKKVTAPPEDEMMPGNLREVVYTIGDELSFISFMMDLRRILADHPDREDILDAHKYPNLSSTLEHPLLAKQRAEQPARWLRVKLQVEEETSTTLLMRDDNLYVCGFMNQQGVCYELLDDEDSQNMLPSEYNSERLHWGVKYRTILDVANNEESVDILASIGMLGIRNFVIMAVCVLSGYPEYVSADYMKRRMAQGGYWTDDVNVMNPRVALAGLILMVCECARMNSFHDSIVYEWTKKYNTDMYNYRMGLRWDDVWKYGEMSHDLRKWKSRNYAGLTGGSSVKAIYLVLNTRLLLGADNTNSRSKHQEYGSIHGRPRVELLAMRADFGVVGTKIIVYDGKQGQVIYRKREQGEQGMNDLVLTGPNTRISAYGCFAIKIDIPDTATPGSGSGDAGGPIKWEWDCYDPEFAAEVDDKPKTVTRTISSSGPGRNVEVTYAVMPDALEATVQVKLLLKDAHSPSVHGNITTCIGDFEARSVLFRRTKGMGQRFSPTDSRFLQLARSVVAVPLGWVLRIEVDLQIETSNKQGCKHLKVDINFDYGIVSQIHEVDGDIIEVNISWYPEHPDDDLLTETDQRRRQPDISYIIGDKSTQMPRRQPDISYIIGDKPTQMPRRQPDISYTIGDKPTQMPRRQPDISYIIGDKPTQMPRRQPDISYIIGDEGGFSTFIKGLRNTIVDYCTPRHEDVLEYQDPSSQNHPVISKGSYKERRWLEIKLKVAGEEKSTTLAVRTDSLNVIGFMNRKGNWYELETRYERKLPRNYNSVFLEWGRRYHDILRITKQEVVKKLDLTRLDKTFGVNAVGALSRYPHVVYGDNPRLALVGLSVMVCDSARMNPVHDAVARGLKIGMGFTNQLMDYIENWGEISRALLVWKDHRYKAWIKDEQLESIGIKSPEDALDVVHLVRRVPIQAKQLQRSVYVPPDY